MFECGRRIHFEKTRAAVNGATLRRIKGNGCVTAALGAINGNFDFLFDARFVGGDYGVEAFVFSMFAFFTAFRRVL